ncbi:type II toxin-antitoxin system RelE/ParE family toxin [Desulfococcaceae bacterium HSG8]|nr:type II toxin-antitoxin system RelE/ParE family toxin [Desulfococcaceae bacterium HSG8]
MDDLNQSAEYIAQHNMNAARKLASRIWNAVQMLAHHPEMGRPGRISGTRELVVSGTSYIVPYRIRGDEIQILRVLHGARKWPFKFGDSD